jgi:hypothetical protein
MAIFRLLPPRRLRLETDIPILRLKKALAEINSAAPANPLLAAVGAVILLEKLSPAITQVEARPVP